MFLRQEQPENYILMLQWENYIFQLLAWFKQDLHGTGLGNKAPARGQSYNDFYTIGQIYKTVLKNENNALTQNFVCNNVRTLQPDIILGLHFYLSLNMQFRQSILHRPKV